MEVDGISNIKNFDDIDIIEHNVVEMLKELNETKSPGAERISPRVMKECTTEFAEP